MKKHIAISGLALALGLASAPAQAASFLSITVGATTVTCDNTASTCGAGFTTAIGSDTIQFTGSINGVSFGGGGAVGVQLTGNSPGTPALAFTLDTKTALNNLSGTTQTVTIVTGQNNFTAPVGTGTLSASQTANWTTSTSTDTQAYTAWLRNTNDFIVPGGNATATTPMCTSPGGLSQSCNQEGSVAATSTAPFALTGREIITLAAGTIASYTGTAALQAQRVVPEPVTLSLLGAGLAGVAMRRRRQRA